MAAVIPNVVRGSRASGLLTYLVDVADAPGRSNEHEEPHLVAGDDALMAWFDDNELSRDAGLRIARHLDRPQRAFGTEVKGGHVWHCSLSLRASEGILPDDKWRAIADDFVAAMEFDGAPVDGVDTKAPCRWTAVRHGVSANGNDHVHLVVNLVREDGTKASIHNDFARAQAACRALEVRHELEPLESAQQERSTRGYDPAEREAQARARARARYERGGKMTGTSPDWYALAGADRQRLIAAETVRDEPRYVLAVKVRGAAASSTSEAEFVRRMRDANLLVRPRFAEGTEDVVRGYSVAARPVAGERPIWYGGGHLARDLTLPRLRAQWEDSPEGASHAASEWRAAKRNRRVSSRPPLEVPNEEAWGEGLDRLSSLVSRVQQLPLEDRASWIAVARETSGALAAWSNAVEVTPGDLAAASEALSRSAQTYSRPQAAALQPRASMAGAALLVSSLAHGGKGTVAQVAMVTQLLRLAKEIHRAQRGAQQARHAAVLAGETRARLARVRDRLQSEVGAPASTGAPVDVDRTAGLDEMSRAALDRMNASRGGPRGPVPAPLPEGDSKNRPRPQRDRTDRTGIER